MNYLNKFVICATIILMCYSCSNNSSKEKYQSKRNNIINVKAKLREIKTGDILVGSIARMHLIGKYLIVADYNTSSKLIHIFDKNNFRYITSCAPHGQGPSEITNMGHIEIDNAHRRFYVSDHGKQKIFSYDLDSVLLDPKYIPKIKTDLKKTQFPSEYYLINDTISIARIIAPTGNSGYSEFIAKWNMSTGEITPMKYKHPDIDKRRVVFDVSKVDSSYVECYSYHDLMTICDFSGKLRYNIYGPNWDSEESKKIYYYSGVKFCGNKIIALYSGNENSSKNYLPTKLIVFNTNGDYIQTLETGYKIVDFCYDKENDRILMTFDDIIQFGYLDLKGLNK